MKPCPNCSRPEQGRKVFHPGECPGISARALQHVISPFTRHRGADVDRQLYARSNYANAPGHTSPWGRDPNPGAYASQRQQPIRLRKRGAVSVAIRRSW